MTNLIALLQVLVSLLVTIQGNPNISAETKISAISLANKAIELSSNPLTIETIASSTNSNNTTTSLNNTTPLASHWPNYERLQESLYLTPEGNRVLPGTNILPRYEHLAFGDLNSDGLDDAMVIVRRTKSSGGVEQVLAPMINQGEPALFNADTLFLGGEITVYKYRIANNQYLLEASVDNQPTFTRYYQLFGDELRQVEN